MSALQTGQRELPTAADVGNRLVFVAPITSWGYRWLSHARPDGVILAHLTVRRCVARRRIRHGGDLQGGVTCRRCNAKAVNLASGEVRCGEIGAVMSSAEISEAVKCR